MIVLCYLMECILYNNQQPRCREQPLWGNLAWQLSFCTLDVVGYCLMFDSTF